MKKCLFTTFLLLGVWVAATAQVRRSLGPPVNHPNFNEYAPSISANGKLMIFESDRGPNGRWELFFTAKNDKGRWTTPKPLTKINAKGKENDLIGGPSISYDGNTLFFFASFEGGQGDMDIYYSTRNGEEWSEPQNLGPVINSSRYEGFPSVSPDGKKLYFIRDNFKKRKDKEICYTIWASTRKDDGSWGEPEMLPAPVNVDCEKSPRIMADGRTLIFSSVRPGGMGSFDLYQSFQEDDGSWGEPINLSYINTDAADQFASVSAAGDLMYYHNSGDIFTVTIPDKFRKYKLVTLDGKVVDAVTKQVISTKLTFKSNVAKERALVVAPQADGTFNTILRVGSKYGVATTAAVPNYFPLSAVADMTAVKEGENIDRTFELMPTKLPFRFQLLDKETKAVIPVPKVRILDVEAKTEVPVKVEGSEALVTLAIGTNYKISASAEGYAFFARAFKPDTTEITKLNKKIPIGKLKKNEPIVLNDITFDTGKADLKPESFEELDRVAKMLEDNPKITIELSAHTDDTGNDDSNLKLSDKRAKSVMDYMVSKGIKAERMTAKGYGETQPLVPNDSDENRAKNRRVQFKIN